MLAYWHRFAASRFAKVMAFLLVLSLFAGVYASNLDGWLINDDEGTFLYQVWQTSLGEQPYQDMFVSRWPVFIYSGARWMKIFGVGILQMRLFSVFLTLCTAALVFLLAWEVLSEEGAMIVMVAFLVHPQIFAYGRTFRTEPLQLLLSVLGLFLFVRGYHRRELPAFVFSGLTLAVATLTTILSGLVVLGCFLSLVSKSLHGQRREALRWMLAFLLPYSLLFGGVAAALLYRVPNFYQNVIGYNLQNGNQLSGFQQFVHWLAFCLSYFTLFVPLFLFALPSIKCGLRKLTGLSPLAWQIPTVLAFLVLSRALFPRLLVYLVPSLLILFVASLEPLRSSKRFSYLYLIAIVALLLPWLMQDTQVLNARESDTEEVARYIQCHTAPNTHVLSDYATLNFYARRPSTYLASELSQVLAESGVVTSEYLIEEIRAFDVKMVIIDVSPRTAHHMVSLRNYQDFHNYIQAHFMLLKVMPRGEQELEIWMR